MNRIIVKRVTTLLLATFLIFSIVFTMDEGFPLELFSKYYVSFDDGVTYNLIEGSKIIAFDEYADAISSKNVGYGYNGTRLIEENAPKDSLMILRFSNVFGNMRYGTDKYYYIVENEGNYTAYPSVNGDPNKVFVIKDDVSDLTFQLYQSMTA